MKRFFKSCVSSLVAVGIAFFVVIAIASSINGVSIPTQFANWFIG